MVIKQASIFRLSFAYLGVQSYRKSPLLPPTQKPPDTTQNYPAKS
jgi:hypothetical protein